jgi:microcystin degradation protein MlrC
MLVAGEKSDTSAEPMLSLIKQLKEVEKRPGILAASFLLGFPWADHEDNAVSALVSGFEEKQDAVENAAGELAAAFWTRHKDFKFAVESYDAAGSVKTALKAILDEGFWDKNHKPVFISDSGDNPTAGSTGDSSDLLERLLENIDKVDKLPTPLLYTGFFDKPAVEACFKAGEGKEIGLTIGGNWDRVNGKKIALKVKVIKLFPDYSNYKSDLALVKYRNMLITLTEKHIGFGDDKLLEALGLNAADYSLVCVKLGYLEPCFRRIAGRAIMGVTRGCSNEALETIPYKRVKRPLYPLDDF